MKKRIALLLILILLLPTVGLATEEYSVSISEQSFEIGFAPAFIHAYLVNGNNYIRLRDLASAVTNTLCQFDVGYNEETETVIVNFSEPYEQLPSDRNMLQEYDKKVKIQETPFLIDGEKIMLKTVMVNGNNFIQLRDIAPYINMKVEFEAEKNKVFMKHIKFYDWIE